MSSKKIAIVTRASSGMGYEYVMQLPNYIKNIDEIWVMARREDKLKELEKVSSVKIVPFVIDLKDDEQYTEFENRLKEEKPNIRILINSAGFGIHGYFEEQSEQDAIGMIDLNCHALAKMTHICLPYMHTNSRIINMASSAAFFPQKRFSVYAASKAFVLNFSRSLNVELKDRKVYVTAVCPGPVDTAFFQKDNCDINKTFYKKIAIAKPKDVVRLALRDCVKKKELSIYGSMMKLFYVVTKIVPHRIMLPISKFIL